MVRRGLSSFRGPSCLESCIGDDVLGFWASPHGVVELTRTSRFPPSRQKERVRTLVELFTFPRDETARRRR